MYMDGKIFAEVNVHFFWGDHLVSKQVFLALFYLMHTTVLFN